MACGVQIKVAAIATLALLCAPAGTQAIDGDITANPGFESPEQFDWSGSAVVAEPSQTRPHSGDWCLHIRDTSKDAVGQASSKPIRVALKGGGRFYAEAWIRIDDDATNRTGYASASVDIAFYDADGNLLLTQPVAKTSSTQWARVSNLVTLPCWTAIS